MKPYGVKRKDKVCCAGHSKYDALDNQHGEKLERRQRPAKKSARQAGKVESEAYWDSHVGISTPDELTVDEMFRKAKANK